MTKTLERALAPLMIIGSFCDLSIFEYPRGQPRAYLSCLYALIKWSFLTYYVYYPVYIYQFQIGRIYYENFVPLLSITLILISFCRFKELKMCLRKLAIVDDTLEVLGTPKEYQRLRNWIIRIIIGWLAYIFSKFACFNIIYYFFDNNYGINSTFVAYMVMLVEYSTYVIVLNILISATILGLVRVYTFTL
ncbi:hypothetical protein ALC60_07535 [Trachymyrmex zeteki]|uniref:Gustatory receptor n=1 Tax=Mycetomoellerius zeteki TaxID=64791 RepID=A0A151WZM1_9HYME|nr:hypothetical protein ALC60_07535 [Trachymyrmex zeteki]